MKTFGSHFIVSKYDHETGHEKYLVYDINKCIMSWVLKKEEAQEFNITGALTKASEYEGTVIQVFKDGYTKQVLSFRHP